MNVFKLDDPNGNTLGTVEAVFPKTIFRDTDLLSNNDLLRLKSVTENILKQGTYKNTALSVDSTHRTDNLINYSDYDILKNEILKRVKGYAELLGYCSTTQMKNLRITNMWANKSYQNDFIFPHVHTNSDFSGVFYIEAPDNATITFYDNIYDMSKDVKVVNMFSSRYTQYPCTPNSLLLFKSNMLHGNEKQGTGDKIAISFNIVFDLQ